MNAERIHSGKATQSLRDIKFTQFLENNGLTSLVHLSDCNGPKYSYIIMEKMLDYIVMPSQYIDMLNSISVLQDDMYHVSDHLPVMAVIRIPITFINITNRSMKVAWHKINGTHVQNYQLNLSSCLKLLKQYCTIEQMRSDAHSITLNNFKKIHYMY